MAKVRVITSKEGGMHVECDLPPGQQCHDSDEELAVVLEILGVKMEDRKGGQRRPGIPNGVPHAGRVKG
ncbi:MAG: hypothetical protein UU08_C0031G0006 [Candidatus Uhrbacteria bacterium GW2011_GWE2_40_58]|nr:MAG: hypothetical protein UT94_C0031G0007 [Candidatus Uhrbacteria bacterium GW2011_GWF2_40_263]KKR66876.1 MAG: hypothetical protein UU08_C0031G0006 [Candidatus Uhrbacteria bacterium GW2011_GWE2_40_58]OGL93824.1 MAG: hypothetical protein A2239_03970 [Candidatus Uhrbacteria bacterium RIFOXYA2_FULL_40_9]OGL97984.1 MAG: hypothetical protein A2332_00590 [Candidatus Uhrbacteria bacterium RIFOXYB2_FULL_41_18]HBK35242.1 hypothetical protein [Candidatus Uhrbacteria bacterium]